MLFRVTLYNSNVREVDEFSSGFHRDTILICVKYAHIRNKRSCRTGTIRRLKSRFSRESKHPENANSTSMGSKNVGNNCKSQFREFGVIRQRSGKTLVDNKWRRHGFLPHGAIEWTQSVYGMYYIGYSVPILGVFGKGEIRLNEKWKNCKSKV